MKFLVLLRRHGIELILNRTSMLARQPYAGQASVLTQVLGWGILVSGVLVGALWTVRHSRWGFGVARRTILALLLLRLWRTVLPKSQNILTLGLI